MAVSAIVLCLIAACNIDDPGAVPVVMASRHLAMFVVDSSSMAADGASTTLVIARLATSDTFAQRLVTFATSAGTLIAPGQTSDSSTQVTVNVDTLGFATAILRAPRVAAPALVTANTGQDIIGAPITFTLALASALTVDPSELALEAVPDSSITVTARLLRAQGLPSAGASATFSAMKAGALVVGRFGAASPSNDSGLVVARFSASPLDTGTVVITATTIGTGGQLIQGHVTITVYP